MNQIKLMKPKPKEPETRTTSLLTVKGLEALDALVSNHHFTHKAIFKCMIDSGEFADLLARQLSARQLVYKGEIRKSLAIEKKDLGKLNDIAKSTGASRDDFINTGFQVLLKILLDDIEATRNKRLKFLAPIRNLYQQAELIETNMMVDLDDDPVFTEFGEICVRLQNLITTIENDKNSCMSIFTEKVGQ